MQAKSEKAILEAIKHANRTIAKIEDMEWDCYGEVYEELLSIKARLEAAAEIEGISF